jgi:S-adenosylmethionine decarboxylase
MVKHALADIALDSPAPQAAAVSESKVQGSHLYPVIDNDKDYFVERDGIRFAGTHLLIEMWEAGNLDDPQAIEDVLCRAARAASATVLHAHMHRFSPNGGVSGVVVLAESHISIHTWPEREYAAIDIFMCGGCNPYLASKVLRDYFRPGNIQLSEHRRGVMP